jgi:glutamyl-tRNA reductase
MQQTILVVGTNHKFAPISLKESLFSKKISYDILSQKIYAKLSTPLFSEKVVLSTCNRIEIYVITPDPIKAELALRKILSRHHLYTYTNQEAVAHLFHIVCGIDSLVLGESEIFGQIKKAYQTGISEKTVGSILHQLYQQAIHVGKLARTKTAIAAGSSSIAHAVKTLIEKQQGPNQQYKTLIIGAGQVAQQVAKNLAQQTEITIANRTYKTAVNLAKQIQGKAISFEKLEKSLKNFDVIITATNAHHIIISTASIKNIMIQRQKKLCLIDLSNPKNMDRQIKNIKHVFLYKLNVVQKIMNRNFTIRQQATAAVQELIDKETEKFWKKYKGRDTVPVLLTLQKKSLSIQTAELKRTLKKLQHKNLAEKEQQLLAQLSSRISNKMLFEIYKRKLY